MDEKDQLSCSETDEDRRLHAEGSVLVEMTVPDLKLLREAADEFMGARGYVPEGVDEYVDRRYKDASKDERERHRVRVTERLRRMQHIIDVVLATGEEQ